MSTTTLTPFVRATKADVLESPNHIKARRLDSLGSITIAATGGTGAVSFTIEDKPDWDIRRDDQMVSENAGVYSIHPQVPPYALMKSKYVYRATDSATPEPNSVLYELHVECLPAEGYTHLPVYPTYAQPIVKDSIWQLLSHEEVTLADRYYGSGYERQRKITWHIRRHVSDHRVLVHGKYEYTYRDKKTTIRRMKVFAPDGVAESAICELMRGWGCEGNVALATVWDALHDQIPAYEVK